MKRTYRLIFELLNRKQRRNFALLIAGMLVMGVIDLAGVASILPFLSVLANPQIIQERAVLAWVYDLLGFQSSYAFLQFLGVVVFSVVTLSIGIRAATFYVVTRFTRDVATTLGVRRLRQYLARPFEWFLTQHSADLGKSVLNEVNLVASGSIAPAIRVIANSVLLLSLVSLLLFLEPMGAIIMGLLLGVCFGLIYRRLRGYLLRIGHDRRVAMKERHKITTEALGGIREVKVLGLEDVYVDRFYAPSWRLARHQAAVSLLGEMPRYVLEGLTFGGMLIFILFLLWSRDGGLEAVAPVLGAFAFAGLKLMPTLQMLFSDLAQMRFGQPTLEALHDDLSEPLAPSPLRIRGGERPIRLQKSLRLEQIRYTYPNSPRPALDGLSLTIPAGTSAGFIGSTGAGKSTAIDLILGLLTPDAGQLSVDGVPITEDNRHHWQAEIGYVPQSIFLSDDTVAANIAFGEKTIDPEALHRAARLAHVDDFVTTLPKGYDTIIGERGMRFSGGQRQRIGIARALYHNPDIVIFDEATSALDTVTERAVMDAIQSLHGQKTVLIIAHRLSTVAQCDQIFLLKDGRVENAGRFDTLLQDSPDFQNLIAAGQ